MFFLLGCPPLVVNTRIFTFLVGIPTQLNLPLWEGRHPKLHSIFSNGGFSIDMLVYQKVLLKPIKWLMMVG